MMKLVYNLRVCKTKIHICAVKSILKPRQAKEDNPLVFNLFARGRYKEEKKIFAGHIIINIHFSLKCHKRGTEEKRGTTFRSNSD